jgi:hypothetical protein
MQHLLVAAKLQMRINASHLKDQCGNFLVYTTMRNQFLCFSVSQLRVQFSPKAAL